MFGSAPSNSTSTTAPITCDTRPFMGFVITLPRHPFEPLERLVHQSSKYQSRGDSHERRNDQSEAPESLHHSTKSSTGMLPRVAFEYGQTWCAASISSFICSGVSPGTWIFIRAAS